MYFDRCEAAGVAESDPMYPRVSQGTVKFCHCISHKKCAYTYQYEHLSRFVWSRPWIHAELYRIPSVRKGD